MRDLIDKKYGVNPDAPINSYELKGKYATMPAAVKEVWVDPVKPVPTRTVRHRFHGFRCHPREFAAGDIGGWLYAMFGIIFQKQGSVKESQVKEVAWGFKQANIPEQAVYDGFKRLKETGYVIFTDERGNPLLCDLTGDMWYKFTDKYLDLLLDEPVDGGVVLEKPEVDDIEVHA